MHTGPERDAEPESEPRHGLGQTEFVVLSSLISATIAISIDTILPAFDELSEAFDLDARDISPAITGTVYFGGMAVGQLLYGILADRFGRRPILVAGISIYAIGAVASALSPNLELLLVGRCGVPRMISRSAER